MKNIRFLLVGIFFGIVLIKAEVVSWFRIQEMFRFHSFHMYGIIGSAVVVSALSIFLIKKFNIRTIDGRRIDLTPKPLMVYANFTGGFIFGLGWAFTGACPGPIYALIGYGAVAYVIVLASAYIGALVYGLLKSKLPH